jgi:hypothetical protein
MNQNSNPPIADAIVEPASPKKPAGPSVSTLMLIIFLALGIPLLICGIGGWIWLQNGPDWGSEISEAYSQDAGVVGTIGGITSISYDGVATSMNRGGYDGDVTVWAVRGPQGSAKIIIIQPTASSTLGEHQAIFRHNGNEYPLTFKEGQFP